MSDLVQSLKLRYPEFETIPEARLQLFIEDAMLQVSKKAWGKLYEQGVLALAAHLLKITPTGKGGGSPYPVSSKTAGSLSIGYAVPTTSNIDEALLATTVYGQRYIQLRKLIATHIRVVSWPQE